MANHFQGQTECHRAESSGQKRARSTQDAFKKKSEQGRGRLVPAKRRATEKRGDEAVPAPFLLGASMRRREILFPAESASAPRRLHRRHHASAFEVYILL